MFLRLIMKLTKAFCCVFCSEGVFKCPEDQLPLDYAKVQFLRLC